MNTPITDAAWGRYFRRGHAGENLASPMARLELDRAALMEALEGLVKANEDWNAAVAQIVITPPTWSDSYLAASRSALAAARANFPKA